MSSEGGVDILLVDDNPGDVLLTIKAFERTSLAGEIHVASDGEEAMDFLTQRGQFEGAPRPDLILLDINLPKISGGEVLRRVKTSKLLRRIPVVMLTSSDSQRDIAAAYDAHANSYITKPPSLTELVDAIRQLQDYWFDLVRRADAAHG